MNRYMINGLRVGMLSTLALAGEALSQSPSQEEGDEVLQATRDAQDPTAAVNGIFFSNSIGFGPNSDNNLYNLQVQPVATVVQEQWGDVVVRGIVPVLGVPTPSGDGGLDTEFGISDTVVQLFYVPRQEGGFKFGFGPQVSLSTHSEDESQSAGWGAGPAFGGFGFAGPLSIGGLINHLWGEDDYSVTTAQPIVYYNLESPGVGPWFFGYNAQVTYDWDSEDFQVPVGATIGKTFLLPSRHAVTAQLGAYDLVEAPDGGNDWELRFALNILFP